MQLVRGKDKWGTGCTAKKRELARKSSKGIGEGDRWGKPKVGVRQDTTTKEKLNRREGTRRDEEKE